MDKKRIIAIYLPQYHPFKENDEWWGKGFTEWTNVTKARPLFPGHYQPHFPADLGFYDLRVSEVREQQAQMAMDAGIYGFCYYHYWFNGHQLMERPLEEILESGKPDFPFMLCWANENWTRAWDGGEKQILIKQDYSEEDDREHIKFLIKNYFNDSRYIRVNNKPIIAIYRTTRFPDTEKTISIWREEAKKEDLELYICRFESFREIGSSYMKNGIDAAIEFQPHNAIPELYSSRFKFRNLVNHISTKILKRNIIPNVLSYKKYVSSQLARENIDYKRFPCVSPRWDNSPRRPKNFWAFSGATPERFGSWLKEVFNRFIPYSSEENFIFINAWNEWAEGNHLEPDKKYGNRFLLEVKNIIDNNA